jgi:hypothetical protein
MCIAEKNKTPSRGVLDRVTPCTTVGAETGAGNETRTRDPDLGKVVLYQLSYSRRGSDILGTDLKLSTLCFGSFEARCLLRFGALLPRRVIGAASF